MCKCGGQNMASITLEKELEAIEIFMVPTRGDTWVFWKWQVSQTTKITTPVLWWMLYLLMVTKMLNLHLAYQHAN